MWIFSGFCPLWQTTECLCVVDKTRHAILGFTKHFCIFRHFLTFYRPNNSSNDRENKQQWKDVLLYLLCLHFQNQNNAISTTGPGFPAAVTNICSPCALITCSSRHCHFQHFTSHAFLSHTRPAVFNLLNQPECGPLCSGNKYPDYREKRPANQPLSPW